MDKEDAISKRNGSVACPAEVSFSKQILVEWYSETNVPLELSRRIQNRHRQEILHLTVIRPCHIGENDTLILLRYMS